jgi:hypothetical protein
MPDRTATLRVRRGPRPATVGRPAGNEAQPPRAPLDPAGLILELEMATLVRRVGHTLRRSSDARTRSLWRRLFGKLSSR